MPAPNTPQDLIDRIRDLERQVKELTGRLNIRPALNTIVGGTVTVKGGGSLIVEDTDGTQVLRIGQNPPDVGGQPQQATVMRRMDGTLALAVWTGVEGAQVLRLYDKNSEVIFSEDTAAGGLAQPWVPLPSPTRIDTANWPSTASTSYTTLARSWGYLQHPKLLIAASITTSGTAVGNLRFLVNDVAVLTGANGEALSGIVSVPNWNWTGTPVFAKLELQARVTSGSGSVYGNMLAVYGRQS